jgi:predicted PurR-regulated permease PerM
MNHALHEPSVEATGGSPLHHLVLASSNRGGAATSSISVRSGGFASRLSTLPVAVIALVLGITALRVAQDFIVPLVLGVLIAYVLDPIVRTLQRAGIPRWLAAAAIVTSLVVTLGALAYALGDTFSSAINQLPAATGRLREELRSLGGQEGGAISALGRAADDLEAAASEAAGLKATTVTKAPVGLSLRESLLRRTMTILGMTTNAFMLMLFVYFLLAAGDLFKRKIVGLAGPTMARRKAVAMAIDDINRHIEKFLSVVISMNVLVALCTWAAFSALGVANAGAWAIMAGLLNAIPFLGSAVAAVVFFLAALLQFDTIGMALVVVGVFALITSLESMLLTPWLLGRTVRMNNVALFASLLFWGWLWGPWGMALSFPIMAVIKTVVDHVEPFRPVSEILGR